MGVVGVEAGQLRPRRATRRGPQRVVQIAFLLGVAVTSVLASAAAGGTSATAVDHAAFSRNILTPGQAGGVAFTTNSTDQAKLYDALTPLQNRVDAATVARLFKPAPLGLGAERVVSTERPRPGVVIRRDRFGVPHITGRTAADVAFGAGWATARDRQLIMELLRGAGRLAALDAPGVDAFGLALQGKTFVPSVATEQRLRAQFELLARTGAEGRQAVVAIDAYIAGINAAYRRQQLQIQPWTRADIVAVAGLVGGVFGSGGGDEIRRSEFLARLQASLGAERGRGVWEDLRQRDDPDARTAVTARFEVGKATSELGNVVVDPGSVRGPAALRPAVAHRVTASNAVLVGGRRSATGRPLAVMGPQVGYYYPGILLELDLQGGGYAARGAAFPGISFAVLLGRGEDFAWSATSANLDLVDQYVETLCEGSDTKYLWNGACRSMTLFDAGTIKGAPGTPDQPVSYYETVHGPVQGYATVNGTRVAITSKRSTRDRELLSASFFLALNTGKVRSAKDFVARGSRMEMTFNWHYLDHKDIAMVSSGRLPVRPATVDQGLPAKGTGQYEWQGFVAPARHPQQINPPSGLIVNWNNKPARGLIAADSEWAWGSVQRVDLLWAALQGPAKQTPPSVVGAMNLAATQDLRAVRVWPIVSQVLAKGTAPTPRARAAAALVDAWVLRLGSRLDADLDGKVDDPGAAVLDAAWTPLTEAVMGPVLGPLTNDLRGLVSRSDDPRRGASAFYSGWYGYLAGDLRRHLGQPARFSTSYCGNGVLEACVTALWSAIDQAAAGLETSQGLVPSAWRSDALGERIRFTPGILPDTMRWTNRPGFQQVIGFKGHR